MRTYRNQLVLILVTLPALLVTGLSLFFLLTNTQQPASDLHPAEDFNALGIAAQAPSRGPEKLLRAESVVRVAPARDLAISEHAPAFTLPSQKISARKVPTRSAPTRTPPNTLNGQAPQPQPSLTGTTPQIPAQIMPETPPQASGDDHSGKEHKDQDHSGRGQDDEHDDHHKGHGGDD
ncbi:MAG: hypothetical protein HY741_24790 [Chloroflexi bacterium]|nr:hypothetical protein [Chloroflexota bacterium]